MESQSNEYNVDFTPHPEQTMPLIKRIHFREKPLEVRVKKFQGLMSQKENANRIPIICELHKTSQLSLKSDLKFLTHQNMVLKSFHGSVRKKMNFSEDAVLFFYHGKTVLKNQQSMGELYQKYKSEDGFLYLQFSEINALG